MKRNTFNTVFHLSKLKKQEEREAEQALARLQQEAARQHQELFKIREEAFALINSVCDESLQTYQAEYAELNDKISQQRDTILTAHQENLLALSYFLIYGRSILLAEYISKLEELQNAKNIALQNVPEDNFIIKFIFGPSLNYMQAIADVESQFEAAVALLDAEMDTRTTDFVQAYYENVSEEQEYVAAQVEELKNIQLALTESMGAFAKNVEEFRATQTQTIEAQYQQDLSSINNQLNKAKNDISYAVREQVKHLKKSKMSALINASIIVVGSVVLWQTWYLWTKLYGEFAALSINGSIGTTVLSAVASLVNSKNSISIGMSVNLAANGKRSHIPQTADPNYDWNSPATSPNGSYGRWDYSFNLTGSSESWNVNSTDALFNNNSFNADTFKNTYRGFEYVAPRPANISFGAPESAANFNTQTGQSSHPFNHGVESNGTQVQTKNNSMEQSWLKSTWTGLKGGIKLGWDAFLGKQTPEVLAWQQQNRAKHPTLAALSDGVADSKQQRVVNAFSEGFVGPIQHVGMFIREEAARLEIGEQTKSEQFVRDVGAAACAVGTFLNNERVRLQRNETTQTSKFFNQVLTFLDADINRLRAKQPTVIGTAIEEDFNALLSMSAEEAAYRFGHEVRNGLLLFGAGKTLQIAFREFSTALDSASKLAKTFGERSPIVFRYDYARLNSGFPFDAVKLRKANSINSQVALNRKLDMLQLAQKRAYKVENLPDGRIRYKTKEIPAKTSGPTRGACFVTEYNPKNGIVRTWYECYDQSGNINRIHPKTINGENLLAQHYPPTQSELKSWFKNNGGPN